MSADNHPANTPRRTRILALPILLLLAITSTAVVYLYNDDRSPGELLVAAYHKVFGLPVVPWVSVKPETEGINKARLDEFAKQLALRHTRAFILVRGSHIVFEWYAGNIKKTTKFSTAAMAKAVTAIPVLLSALSENRIKLDDPLWKYYPALEHTALRSQILIRHLAFHTSGIEDVDFNLAREDRLEDWKMDYYKNRSKRFHVALDSAPVNFTPGTRGEYSGVGYYALAYAITKSLQGQQADNLKDYLRTKIMRPLDIPDSSWKLNYGESYLIDGMELYAIGSGATYTARATARIGELMLNNGIWQGRNLLNPEWIDEVLARNTEPGPLISENHGWTLNKQKLWPSLPPDAFAGLGNNHQVILVIPSLDLVMVRHGASLDDDSTDYHSTLDELLFKPLMETVDGAGSRH